MKKLRIWTRCIRGNTEALPGIEEEGADKLTKNGGKGNMRIVATLD